MSSNQDLSQVKMNTADSLRVLFNPKTVAVVGATNNKESVGYGIMHNILGSGFEGIVYPVNRKRISIQGVRAYPGVKDIPDRVDLAVVATPAAFIPQITEECGEAGIKAMVIISAGFLEAGEEGKALFARVKAIAKKYNIRFVGPNCLGFIRPSLNLNASFANKMALPGRIAFISQSGALCTSILDWSVKQKVGFNYFVSVGSQGDVGIHDLIDYFGSDSKTSCILIYMESLTNAKRFMSAARAFARTKPIIILKVGKSAAGAAAAMSHTGSLSGDDAIFDAAFERAGVIRVNTIAELFNAAQTLSSQPRPRGNRLAIVTNAGGPGVISSDELSGMNGEIAKLSQDTINHLGTFLPAAWSHGNPVDVLGDADAAKYKGAVEACLKDANTDGVLVILTPQSMTNAEDIARQITTLRGTGIKPILTSWMGADDVEKGKSVLEQAGIPVFNTPESAVRCFMYMYQYSRNIKLLTETPESEPREFSPNRDANKLIIKKAAAEGRKVLTEYESKLFLANYEIPIGEFKIATNMEEAADIAAEIGFPVAMKILSPDILHKTDVGGVRINVSTREEAMRAHEDIMAGAARHKPEARLDGILVEKMVKKRFELFVGCKKDPIFGPVIVFGLGGVNVEVFKDTNIGLPPLNMGLSRRLIEDTKIFTLLKGYRGMEGVELKSLQFLLLQFSYLVMDFPEISELDINPIGIDSKGSSVLDAKIILDENILKNPVEPYSHLVIAPYPRHYERRTKLNNNVDIFLRPVKPEDESIMAEMFTRFSESTERFRFFQFINSVTHDMLVRYTQNDYDREIAIMGEVKEDGIKKMVGVARLMADPYNDNAEFAIVVADPWQKQGLGNQFTDYMLEIARERKLKKVYAHFLKNNHAMRHIFEKRGFKITPNDDVDRAELLIN